MDIENRPVSSVVPYKKNPRVNDGAVDAVAHSIQTFGWRQPIVVDGDGVIICGHTRWKAAQKLGLEMVPVHVATDLTPEQVKAYRIADNKTASIAEWDAPLLAEEIAELRLTDLDLDVLGFDEDDFAVIGFETVDADASAPESVKQNIEELRAIRQAGNDELKTARDSERYLVVVFPSRAEKHVLLKRIGLPEDERYVDAASVKIMRRIGFASQLMGKEADAKHAGVTG